MDRKKLILSEGFTPCRCVYICRRLSIRSCINFWGSKFTSFYTYESPGNTDIARALQLSTGIVEQNKATRIVLFTDGLETSGSVADELVKITGGKVTIDVVQLERVASEDVAITSFETPPVAFEGEQQQLNVKLEATTDTKESYFFIKMISYCLVNK